MIARELTEFFAGFGDLHVFGDDEPVFLSNVNACYRRECWAEVRFADVRYAEDQAFAREMGARGLAARVRAGSRRAARARLLAAGLRAALLRRVPRAVRRRAGTSSGIGVRSTVRDVRGLVASDRRWMREQGWDARRRATSTGRSLVHHTSRKFASALGSRAHRLPPAVADAVSLEARGDRAAAGPKTPIARPRRRARTSTPRSARWRTRAPCRWRRR